MQRTTARYRKSMKEDLRGDSFMMVTFGLINQEVQAHASVRDSGLSYLSTPGVVFDKNELRNVYATLEDGFTRVDGSMLFPPIPNSNAPIYSSGIISEELASDKGATIIFDFNTVPYEIKGLTLDFGEIYAEDFDIAGSNGQVIHIKGNKDTVFVTQEVLSETTYIKLTFYKMKNKANRVRIYSMLFGFGLVYRNEDIMDSELESYVSSISEDIPQYDFSIKLKNYDRYFDVDNPDSAINYIETGQQMSIVYGYQPRDGKGVEWLPGQTLFCSSWKSDDSSVTIECQDIFRNMDEEYFRGTYTETPVSLYELAERVFNEYGIEDFDLDPYLKTVYTQNPIPRLPYKQVLQIIANAGRCVLAQSRDGIPEIQTSFIPDYSIASDGKETEYSDIRTIKRGTAFKEYASLATNYTTVNGEMLFPPSTWQKTDAGYVSSQISDSNGVFADTPYIEVTLEAAYAFVGFNMVFGQMLPSKMTVVTYLEENEVETVEITDGIQKNYRIDYPFLTFDKLKVFFNGTVEPNNRIVLHQFSFGDVTNFTMERQDMMNSPVSIKTELVKDVRVSYYVYHPAVAETSITSEERTVAEGDIATYFFDEPAYNYRVTFNDAEVEILESAAYYLKVRFNITGRGNVNIYGYKYNVTEQFLSKQLHNTGKTITWSNPLLGDEKTAEAVLAWLGDYYSVDAEYEYETRGNPEIDANDIIYQENDYNPELQVEVYRHTIKFSQGISGRVEARRKKRALL